MDLGAPSPPKKDYPPFVVLVDVDGTIIGDIDAQLIEYQLIVQPPAAKKSSTSTTLRTASFREKMFRDQLVSQLLNGLMRPGFSAFCAQCSMLGIPVMLYTAAENVWANFLAPSILQAVRIEMERDLENPPRNFKFAKVFTRKSCIVDKKDGSCTKSLEKIGKDMHTVLKKEYAMVHGIPGLLQRTILIDNTPGVLREKDHLVAVPTYEFAYIYDVTMNIDHTDTRRMARAKALLTSSDSFLNSRVKASATTSNADPFRAWLYAALAKKLKETSKPYEHARHYDQMWKTLRKRLVSYFHERQPFVAGKFAKYMMGHFFEKMT